MKWIGQHIWDFISRFRTTVYIENLETSSEENVLVVDSDGKVTKNTTLGGSDLTITDASNNRIVTSSGGSDLLAETYATFQNTGNTSTLILFSDQNTSDFCSIATTTNGVTKIQTVDADAALANLTLQADGDIDLDAGGGDINFKSGVTTFGTISSNSVFMKQTKVTLSESDCNDLHNTPVTLVAAPGANKIIVPVNYLLLADRDASTAQGESGCDMMISYDGSTTGGKYLGYMRRFMYNEAGDRTYMINGSNATSGENWDTNDPSNKPLKIAFDSACTSGSLDSVVVYTTYYIVDNS